MEDILDSLLISFMEEDEGHSIPASFLTVLELSEGGPVLPPAPNPARLDLIWGIACALLVHVIAAAAFLLMPLLQPRVSSPGPFIKAYIVDMKLIGIDSSSAGGTTAGIQTERHPDRRLRGEKTREKQPGPHVHKPKLPRRSGSPAKSRENPSSQARKKHALSSEALPDDSHKATTDVKDRPSGDSEAGSEGSAVEAGGNEGAAGEHNSGKGTGGFSPTYGISGEFDAASMDSAPQVLKKIAPVYPGRARSLGICGKVVVRFVVEPDGQVSRLSIVEAHPKGFFEQSTLEAIGKWRFKAGRYQGNAVATWVTLPVEFRLTGEN